MPSLKERLENDIARAGQAARDGALCCAITVGDARRILSLLAAAKPFDHGGDRPHGCPRRSKADTPCSYCEISNAIHAIEEAPK